MEEGQCGEGGEVYQHRKYAYCTLCGCAMQRDYDAYSLQPCSHNNPLTSH